MNQSWWPFGPAAAGHLNGRRWRNRPRLSDYLKTVGLPHVEDVEVLLPDQRAGEAFLVGLRVINGMDRKWVDALIEESTDRWRAQVIDRFVDEKLLHWKNDHLALTSQGIFFADTVMLTLLMKDDVITDTTRTVPHA
jgi:coproporphyrinogen III oxidase-like Fe-S oxidoreductase